MYVRSGITAEPPMSGFGSFGVEQSEQSEHSPFDEEGRQVTVDDAGGGGGGGGGDLFTMLASAGITKSSLLSALTSCVGLNATTVANCVWDKIKGSIRASPQAQEILTTLQGLDCAALTAALGATGTSATVLNTVCSLAWPKIQAKVAAALAEVLGTVTPSRQQEYEANYGRGRDRTAAEGGGHTLVDASGTEVGVACPAYPANILYDGDGKAVGLSMQHPNTYPARSACPAGVEIPPELRAAAAAKPRIMAVRSTKTLQTLPPGRVSGRVVDEGGKPIAGAEVRVGSRSNLPAMTDATGAFSASAGATSNQRLFISKEGYEGALVEGLGITSGATVDVGAIPLVASMTPKTEPESPWYTSTWFIVGVVAAAGGAAYLIYRSRKGK